MFIQYDLFWEYFTILTFCYKKVTNITWKSKIVFERQWQSHHIVLHTIKSFSLTWFCTQFYSNKYQYCLFRYLCYCAQKCRERLHTNNFHSKHREMARWKHTHCSVCQVEIWLALSHTVLPLIKSCLDFANGWLESGKRGINKDTTVSFIVCHLVHHRANCVDLHF